MRTPAPFFIFYFLSRLDLVNRFDLVKKRCLTTTFTKSRLGCTPPIQDMQFFRITILYYTFFQIIAHCVVHVQGLFRMFSTKCIPSMGTFRNHLDQF